MPLRWDVWTQETLSPVKVLNKHLTSCNTLTHEPIRSDHISVLYLTDISICSDDTWGTPKKVWQLNKVDWNEWKNKRNTDLESGLRIDRQMITQ
jgi:hypothetical protein